MKEGIIMASSKNGKSYRSLDNSNNEMSGGPIKDDLNSDNSFSDDGLENARLLNEKLTKGKKQ